MVWADGTPEPGASVCVSYDKTDDCEALAGGHCTRDTDQHGYVVIRTYGESQVRIFAQRFVVGGDEARAWPVPQSADPVRGRSDSERGELRPELPKPPVTEVHFCRSERTKSTARATSRSRRREAQRSRPAHRLTSRQSYGRRRVATRGSEAVFAELSASRKQRLVHENVLAIQVAPPLSRSGELLRLDSSR